MMRSWKKVQSALGRRTEDWERVLNLRPRTVAQNNLLFSLIQPVLDANHVLFDEAIGSGPGGAYESDSERSSQPGLGVRLSAARRGGRYWDELLNRWRARLEREPENEYLKGLVIELLREHGERPVEEQEEETAEAEATGGGQAAPSQPRTRAARGVNELKEILKLNPEAGARRLAASTAGAFLGPASWS